MVTPTIKCILVNIWNLKIRNHVCNKKFLRIITLYIVVFTVYQRFRFQKLIFCYWSLHNYLMQFFCHKRSVICSNIFLFRLEILIESWKDCFLETIYVIFIESISFYISSMFLIPYFLHSIATFKTLPVTTLLLEPSFRKSFMNMCKVAVSNWFYGFSRIGLK